MYFATAKFWIFFLALWILYWGAPRRVRPWVLLGASFFYYATWSLDLLLILVCSAFANYWLGLRAGATQRPVFLWTGVVLNLGVLLTFRYLAPYVPGLDHFGPPPVSTLAQWDASFILPVGVSFFTLQSLSFVIDRYRGTYTGAPSVRDFLLYVSFFPQLLAGPLERAKSLIPQFAQKRSLSWTDFRVGAERIVLGLWQKVVVADTLAHLVNTVFRSENPTGPQIYMGCVAFVFQLYGDFAGYSNIAIGVARLLGYELTVNFRRPLFALNFAELWRRWHITVGAWLRDYVYFPVEERLGRSMGLFISMVLMGIWHGSGLSFILMGFYLGVVQVLYAWMARWIPPVRYFGQGGLYRLAVFHAFLPCALFCRVDDFTQLKTLSVQLLSEWSNFGGIPEMLQYSLWVIVPLLIYEWMEEEDRIRVPHWAVRTSLVASGLAMVLMLKRGASMPFIYFVF